MSPFSASTAQQFPRAIRAVYASAAVPRAILRINAGQSGTDPRGAMISELTAAIGDFKAEHRDELGRVHAAVDDLQKHLDNQALGAAAAQLGAGRTESRPADPEYSKLFASFVRKGQDHGPLRDAQATGERAVIHAAMQSGTDGSGGYLAPVEWDRQILKAQVAVSPVRQLASVVTTNQRAFSTLWQLGAPGSGWVGETASRPATSTPTFAPLVFAAGELYAFPQATQGLLDDSAINLEEWLGGEVGTEFARQEGIAFVAGDGVNKPMGFLQHAPDGGAAAVHPGGALSVTNSGAAATLTGDGFVNLFYALAAPYRQNSTWLMSSDTARVAMLLKDGQGNFLWRDGIIAGQPATLLGRPVSVDENMPSVAAGTYPVALGDWRQGYLINDRVGTRVLRDPFTNKPYVGLYVTRRVGGGVRDPRAIRLMKISA